MPQDRQRHVLRDALAMLAVGLLLAAGLEGGTRWLGVGAPDLPEIPPKPPGHFRIVALGGSTVQGVPEGALGFATQLAQRLPELAPPGRRVEVWNLARSGAASAEVRARLEWALDADPDLVIVLTGHNEFIAPRASRGLRGALQRLRDRSWLLRALTGEREAMPPPYAEPIPVVDEALRQAVTRDFLANLDAITATARAGGVPLFLCTAPSNLAEWPPAHRHLARPPESERAARERAALGALLANGRNLEAIDAARRWLERHGEDAMVRYRLARAQRAVGAWGAARENFERALVLDPVPRRAFPSFNDAVRSHAGSPGVTVVDVARLFAEHSQAGLVGFEWICDNCHPTPLANAWIAREIALAMRERGLLLASDSELPLPERWLELAELRLGGAEQRARVQLRWLLSNAIYAMKTPFFDFEASRRYLDRAQRLAPGDWRVLANLGTLSILEGRVDEGRRELGRAAAAKRAPLEPVDPDLTPYLDEALRRAASAAGGS